MKIAIMPSGREPIWITCPDPKGMSGLKDIQTAIAALKRAKSLLIDAASGHASVSHVARELGMMNEDVQMIIWGEIRQ